MMSSLPQGIHNAVCIGVIITGINKDKFGLRKKVVLLWEVYVKDEIKTMSREYTFSYDERATLRMHLESWRGGPFTEEKMSTFQIRNILGVPCKLVIQKMTAKSTFKMCFLSRKMRSAFVQTQNIFILTLMIKEHTPI